MVAPFVPLTFILIFQGTLALNQEMLFSDPYNQKGQPDKTFFSEIDMQETVAIGNLIHFSGIPHKIRVTLLSV